MQNATQKSNSTIDERTRQLERIIDDMQAFIDQQLLRWESFVDYADEAEATRAEAERLRQEVELEKSNWEAERNERLAALVSESELLEQAWQRIESEERRLAAKEAIGERTYGSAPATPLHAPAPHPTAEPTPGKDEELDNSQDRIAAVQEFRKLSMEIANHAKRKR